MDPVPQRPAVARFYRAILAWGEGWVPIPNVNPSWWSLLGLLASAACLFTPSPAAKFALVSFALITDWYDGATARKHRSLTREGYLVDDMVDRFSEAFIFAADVFTSAAARIFWGLWILNSALTMWSVATGRHRVLPLRFLYLFVLVHAILA